MGQSNLNLSPETRAALRKAWYARRSQLHEKKLLRSRYGTYLLPGNSNRGINKLKRNIRDEENNTKTHA